MKRKTPPTPLRLRTMLAPERTFAERSLLRGLVDQLGPRDGLREFLHVTGITLADEASAARTRRKARTDAMLWAADRYAPLREAAWHYRNSRPGEELATRERLRDLAQQLIDQGEHSAEVIDVLLELARSR